MEDFQLFRRSTIRILQQIDESVAAFQTTVESGVDVEEAADRWFPDHGQRTGACEEYGGCQFQRLCQNKPRTEQMLKLYRGRTRMETTESKEAVG